MHKILPDIRKKAIIKSSISLVIIALLVKVFGYGEKLVLAYYFGTEYQVDVYTVSITIVLSIFFLFREIVEPGFLNVFLKARIDGDESGAWNLFNQCLRFIFLLTFLITMFAIIFPDKIIGIFAPGFEEEKKLLSIKLIRIAMPACIFLSASTLTSITLNGLKLFTLPASGELVFKGLILLAILTLFGSFGIMSAVIGIIIGSVGRLLLHFIKLYRKTNFYLTRINKQHVRNVWLLTWPLLIGVMISQASVLFDNIFASHLQDGAIASLSYSKKIVELPVVIFPYVLSIVVFPYFIELAHERDYHKLANLLGDTLKWIVIAFLPISVFFCFFSNEIVEIIFQRGAFNANSTILTSKPLSIYSIGLLFFAIETVLVIFYYANADIKTPVFVGIGCAILNIALTYLLIQTIGYIGIALAFVIQKSLKTSILLVLIKRKIHFSSRKVLNFCIVVFICCIFFTLIIVFCGANFKDIFDSSPMLKLVFLGSVFTIGGLVYLVLLKYSGYLNR